jgi:hypothetical protein
VSWLGAEIGERFRPWLEPAIEADRRYEDPVAEQ